MRIFSAIELPDIIKKNLLSIEEKMPRQDLTLVKENALHITLHFFENINESQIEKVKEAIGQVNIGKFDIDIKGISSFGSSDVRIVFAKVVDTDQKITKIFNDVGAKLHESGIYFDIKEKYIPHITIARSKGRNSPHLKDFVNENSECDFGRMTITEISLIKSELTPEGPMYTKLYDHKI